MRERPLAHCCNLTRPTIAGLLVILALAIAHLATPGAQGQPLRTGITDPEANAIGSQTVPNRIRKAGARFTRLTVLWRFVAPRNEPASWNPASPADPNYNWTETDQEIKQAVRAGLSPLVQVYGAPSWAQRCRLESSTGAPCDPDPAAMARFAKAIASRYNGDFGGLPRIRYWEPQNEPNLSLFFNPQFRNGKPVSPDLYREILNRFSVAVKSVHADNLVATAGFAPLKRPGTVAPLDFVRRLLCMKGRRKPRPTRRGCEGGVRFDILATNPYTTGGPTHEALGRDDVSLGDLPELHRLLRAAERAGQIQTKLRRVPFWVTEFSWDSRPPDPGGLSQRIHARWTSEAMYRAWSAGVSAFFWFQIRDDSRDGLPHDQTVQSGLYLRGDTLAGDKPKRALQAFRFPFVALRRNGGVFVWGRTPNSRGGAVTVQRWANGRWRGVATLRAAGTGIFRRVLTAIPEGGGLLRASYRGEDSVPFSLRYVEDFYQPPFG